LGEGPKFGSEPEKGDYGPYRHRSGATLHRGEALRLLGEHKAYNVSARRKSSTQSARVPRREAPRAINGKCRHLTPEEITAKGDAFCAALPVPEGMTTIHDVVQGDVQVANKEFDDFII